MMSKNKTQKKTIEIYFLSFYNILIHLDIVFLQSVIFEVFAKLGYLKNRKKKRRANLFKRHTHTHYLLHLKIS